jgi:hypothetical protein
VAALRPGRIGPALVALAAVAVAVAVAIAGGAAPARAADVPRAGQLYECFSFAPWAERHSSLTLGTRGAYSVGAWHAGRRLTGKVRSGTWSRRGATVSFASGPFKAYWAVVQRSPGFRRGTLALALQFKRRGSPPDTAAAGISCYLTK